MEMQVSPLPIPQLRASAVKLPPACHLAPERKGHMGLKKGTSSWPPNVAASKCNQTTWGPRSQWAPIMNPISGWRVPEQGPSNHVLCGVVTPRPGTDDTHRHEPKTPKGSQVLWAPSWVLGLSLHPTPVCRLVLPREAPSPGGPPPTHYSSGRPRPRPGLLLCSTRAPSPQDCPSP